MSGTSYASACPKCGADMVCHYDWKPHESVKGQCLECGFSYCTREAQMSLKQVNRLRTERGLPPLKTLRQQTN